MQSSRYILDKGHVLFCPVEAGVDGDAARRAGAADVLPVPSQP